MTSQQDLFEKERQGINQSVGWLVYGLKKRPWFRWLLCSHDLDHAGHLSSFFFNGSVGDHRQSQRDMMQRV
jgi:hypothetical protein